MQVNHVRFALAASYTVRDEIFDGRPHIVVPVVALVEGVHNERFYPAEEIALYPECWNGVPIPIYHPEDERGYLTANEPKTLETRCAGRAFFMKSEENGKKLSGELWIDTAKVNAVKPGTETALREGQPMEVSTALYAEGDGTPGVWNGERYAETVRHYKPDHIALLPGEIGACSVADGCGVRANAEEVKTMDQKAIPFALTPELVPEVVRALRSGGYLVQELSFQERIGKFMELVGGKTPDNGYLFVEDVWEDNFVYTTMGEGETKSYRQGYSVSGDAVELSGDPTEVERKIEYVDVSAEPAAEPTAQEAAPVTPAPDAPIAPVDNAARDAYVDAMIACPACPLTEEDRTWMQTLSERAMEKISAMRPAATPAPVFNTAREYAEAAPPTLRPFFVNSVKQEEDRKAALVAKLAAHPRNKYETKELTAMSAEDLSKLLSLAGEDEPDYTLRAGGSGEDTSAPPVALKVFEGV